MHLKDSRSQVIIAQVVIALVLISGCSGSGGIGPVAPGYTPSNDVQVSRGNGINIPWGFFDIYIDPDTGQANAVPLRMPDFQSNVTRFLQPPTAPINLLSVSIDAFASDFPAGLVVCDVNIKHPFPGTKFRGFDVRGIVMGSPEGPVELLNYDGFTRWWNPVEFTTVGTIFGYTEGALAPPGALPDTIFHPYKYFADSLGAEDPLVIDPVTRGTFDPDIPGTVSRRYELQFPTPGGVPDFHFKYAIMASWEAPEGPGPWDLSDYSITANQPEAYQLSVLDAGSTLYREGASSGGDLKLQITVYDWQKPYNPDGMSGELGALMIECVDLALPETNILPDSVVTPGPDMNSVSYHCVIPNLSPEAPGEVTVWVSAESANVSTYAPDIPGITGFEYPEDVVLAAHNMAYVTVDDEAPQQEDKTIHILVPNGGEVWEVDSEHNIEWETTGDIDFVKLEYRTGDSDPWVEIVPATENDGLYEWTIPDNPSESARVRASDMTDPLVNDISDCQFAIIPADVFIYVDDSSTSPDEFGTMADPYKTISLALSVATDGDVILVDDSDNIYEESLFLIDGVTCASDNWDESDGDERATVKAPDIDGEMAVNIHGVTGAAITGFDFKPGGSYSPDWPNDMVFVNMSGSTDITISNCYFNGEELQRSFWGVYMEDCDNVEICCSHFEHFHGPEPISGPFNEYDSCIVAHNSPNLYIHNVRINDLGTNFNEQGHIVDAVFLNECDNPIVHNNVIYNIDSASGGVGASLVAAFKFESCDSPVIYNNTVNLLDTVDNMFINQAFCYFLVECPNGTFYNNIAANVTVSGYPPPLGRGVQSYLYDLLCDYTLTWNIPAPYFQQAIPNIGCVDSDPLFIDPDNYEHDIDITSEGQLGDPSFVDWDDTGMPSGDPDNPDANTRSRMGCHGGPYGGSVGVVN